MTSPTYHKFMTVTVFQHFAWFLNRNLLWSQSQTPSMDFSSLRSLNLSPRRFVLREAAILARGQGILRVELEKTCRDFFRTDDGDFYDDAPDYSYSSGNAILLVSGLSRMFSLFLHYCRLFPTASHFPHEMSCF